MSENKCLYLNCYFENLEICGETQMCIHHCTYPNHSHCSSQGCDMSDLCSNEKCEFHCTEKNHFHCCANSCNASVFDDSDDSDDSELNSYFCTENSSCFQHCFTENHIHCKYLNCSNKSFVNSECKSHFFERDS